jgi:hypothetical protein
MTANYQQLHAFVRPAADKCGFVGWIIILVSILIGVLRSVHFDPETASALLRWPQRHEVVIVLLAVAIVTLHIVYRIWSFDRQAESLALHAVNALDTGGSARNENSRLLDRLTIEIACVVKIRLGLPVDNPANRQAAWREASAYIREITRPGAKHEHLRHTHRVQHLAGAVTLVFLPTEADMLAKRISTSLTMRQRRRFVAGEVPDFADALLSTMRWKPGPVESSGERSPQPFTMPLIDMESGDQTLDVTPALPPTH